MKAKSPALPCRDGVFVDKGVEAPDPCLSPVEMRTLKPPVAYFPPVQPPQEDHLSPAPSLVLPNRRDELSDIDPIRHVLQQFLKIKILETKTRQTLVFDPDGSTGRLHACPFLGGWRALLCGEGFVWAPDGT